MSNIAGTNIAAEVVPFTTEDQYPTHMALYGKGGWRSVQTLEERDALPVTRLEDGATVWVIATMQAFTYIEGEWQDFGIVLPSYATTETVSCYFPASPSLGVRLIWTAGIDVNFGTELQGVGNIIEVPSTGGFAFDIKDRSNEIVGNINIDDQGVFSFLITNSEQELIIRKGDFLVFQVSTANQDASDISFTISGKRIALPALTGE